MNNPTVSGSQNYRVLALESLKFVPESLKSYFDTSSSMEYLGEREKKMK